MPYKDQQRNRQYHKDYWEKNKVRAKDRRLRKEFGLSMQDYTNLLTQQHGLCAICHKPETVIHSRTGDVQRLSVDHNHETGKIRGLLCSRCNTAVGLLQNDPIRAQELILYLEKSWLA